MHYTTNKIDHTTGNFMTITPDHWVTLPELSRLHRVSISKLETILFCLRILDVKQGVHRLAKSAIDEGLGKRINHPKKRDRWVDVISPLGQRKITENWSWVVQHVEQEQKATKLLTQIGEELTRFKVGSNGNLEPDQEVFWLIGQLTQLKLEQLAILFQDASGCRDWTYVLTGRSASQ